MESRIKIISYSHLSGTHLVGIELIKCVFPESRMISRKAYEGLHKEQKLNGWKEGVVPGYLGEDALYL